MAGLSGMTHAARMTTQGRSKVDRRREGVGLTVLCLGLDVAHRLRVGLLPVGPWRFRRRCAAPTSEVAGVDI